MREANLKYMFWGQWLNTEAKILLVTTLLKWNAP